MRTAIWWIRRDVRLEHNLALAAALDEAECVVPLFVVDPALLRAPSFSERRYSFLLGGLAELDTALRRRGSRLVVRTGPPERVLARIVRETKAEAIYCEHDVSPYARRRDRGVAAALPLRGVWGVSFLTPFEALKPGRTPYTQYTAYRRAWRRDAAARPLEVRRAPRRLPPVGAIRSEPLPDPPVPVASLLLPPGETEAKRRLARFVRHRIGAYADERNRLDREGTSRLSPYLRFGMLSAQRAVATAFEAAAAARGAARRGAETWLDELVWREFYLSILFHFPEVRRESFRGDARFLAWRDDEEGFAAWCAGRTGYPVVDAAMRELAATGFMHNRARMITASFLTKHLLVDWRKGEGWFLRQLLDGDPAANNGGWQWTAGTGTDAAPYFRIFNPVLQARRFDPEGRYVLRWLPELADRPRERIHEPVRPIVSHTEARIRALRAFEKARKKARAAKASSAR